jgi:hypothetical protein
VLLVFLPGNLHDLAVDHIAATQHPQDGKYRYENAPGVHPFVKIIADEEAETDATRHG